MVTMRKHCCSYYSNQSEPLGPKILKDLNLTKFDSMLHLYIPWKHEKTKTYLRFHGVKNTSLCYDGMGAKDDENNMEENDIRFQ